MWPDGRTYEGEYQDDRKHGFGIYTWPDKRQYTGQWEYGLQHGQGIYKDVYGIERTGLWEFGKRVVWLDEEEWEEELGEIERMKEEERKLEN